MNFHILTLFPEMVLGGLQTSITGRAIEQNRIGVEAVNIRDFSTDRHGRVDDYTYGGGAGMLMQAQPVYDAFLRVQKRIPGGHRCRVIYVTPQGRPFTQQVARELSENDDLVLLCGHYEGVDERVLEEIVTDCISIGDYVLTGGELAAMVIVDAVARLVPGVLHNEDSAQAESFHGSLLEYPQYTRPEEWHGKRVPSVLLSGNQREIDRWRRGRAEERTAVRRPDLYADYQALKSCEARLLSDKLHHMDMIELIRRGRAVLVARQGEEILLEDRESRTLFHTWLGNVGEKSALLCRIGELCPHPVNRVVLHQQEMVPELEALGYRAEGEYLLCVYTRKEQLPIAGLYGADGKVLENGTLIREMTGAELPLLTERGAEVSEDWKEKAEERRLCGAFVHGELAGFIGAQRDGSVGDLFVFPKFRKKKVASALETYLFNQMIRQGMTPYGRISVENGAAAALQERLGVCLSKKTVVCLTGFYKK